MRRADRLSHPAIGRRCATARDLWVWRGGAYRGAGRAPSGTRSLSPSPAPATSRRRNSRAASARCGPAARTRPPPEKLDAALIFAPVGALVPAALAATSKGGTVVCGGIHMSDIPAFPYRLLWEERIVRSVANLTRRDAEEFLALAPAAGITTTTQTYPLADANRALCRSAQRRLAGSRGAGAVAAGTPSRRQLPSLPR